MKKTTVALIILVIILQLLILAITTTMLGPVRTYNRRLDSMSIEMEEHFCPYCGQELNGSAASR